jgi:hypothetical protein
MQHTSGSSSGTTATPSRQVQQPSIVYDESISLLSNEKVTRYKDGWWHRVIDVFTFERVKIMVILVILLATIVMFSLKKVEDEGSLSLTSTRFGEPLISFFARSLQDIDSLVVQFLNGSCIDIVLVC